MAAAIAQFREQKSLAGTWAGMVASAMTTTASNFCGVLFVSYDSSAAITGLTDSKGNTTGAGSGKWELLSHFSTTVGSWLDCYVIYGGTGGSGHTITFTGSGSPFGVAYFIEVTGALASGSPFGTLVSGAPVGGSPATLGSGTLAQADNLLLSAIGGASNTFSVGSPWTLQDSEPDSANYWTSAFASLNVTSTANQNVVWTYAGIGNEGIHILPVKSAAAASGYSGTPGQSAITLAGAAVTLARTANVSLIPGADALVLSSPAPTLTQTAGATFVPGVSALTLSGPAPTLARTANQTFTPAPDTIALTGPAPTLSIASGLNLIPAPDVIALATFAPTLARTVNVSLIPDPASFTINRFAPILTQTGSDAYPLGSGGGPLAYFPSQASIREQARNSRIDQWVRQEQAKTRRLQEVKPKQKPIPRPEFKVEPPKAIPTPRKPAKLDKRAIAQKVKAVKLAKKKRSQEAAIARAIELLIR